MKTLNPTGMKWLKTFHILFAILWIGCGVSMNFLRITITPSSPEEKYFLSLSIKLLDDLLIYGGVLGIILTGLIYGIWTKWGFFRQRWLTVKWILTLVMVLIGWIVMGPAVTGNVHENPAWYLTENEIYCHNLEVSALWGPIQLTLLFIVVLISVFKPWKSRK